MTNQQRIEDFLQPKPSGWCDKCLSIELTITPTNQVNGICAKSQLICRSVGVCDGCGENRQINTFRPDSDPISPPPRKPKQAKTKVENYLREEDIKERINSTLVEALGIPAQDYYSQMGFCNLLLLKSGLARIHDIITLKLTLALVERMGQRFNLDEAALAKLRQSVSGIHPNAAGFDLDIKDPNLIGEVKGNIPVNKGSTFGADQLKGLRNDVLQMLGHPARANEKNEPSERAKINRAGRDKAIKVLGLYDSPEVRAATDKWRKSLMASPAWKPLSVFSIQELPETGNLSPDIVYLIYLTPKHGIDPITSSLATKENE